MDVDHPLPALKWGDSDRLQVGDPVLTIGNPLGLGMSVSAGIVSALNRNLHDSPFDNYIQTDAAINYGNSGGPLVDGNGDVVGVDTALYNPEANGGFIGIGFAIPSNLAAYVVRFLLDPNHPKPGWIGVTLQDMNDRLAEAMGVPKATGAIVSAVDPSGPARQADLRPADVLETIDGVQQSDSRAFMRAIVKLPVGTTVHLTGWRDGKPLNATVRVAAWPNYMPAQGVMREQAAQMMIEKAPDPGMRLAPITEQARKQDGLDPTLHGALVSAVEPDCEARDLGIVPGDVITYVQDQPIASPDDVRHAIETAHQERRTYLAMLVQSKSGVRWVSLSITSAEFIAVRRARLTVGLVPLVRRLHFLGGQQPYRSGCARQQILPAQRLQHQRRGQCPLRGRCVHDHAVIGEQAGGAPGQRRHGEPRQFRRAERDIGCAPNIVAAEIRHHVVERRQRLVEARERGAGIGMRVHDAVGGRIGQVDRGMHRPFAGRCRIALHVARQCHRPRARRRPACQPSSRTA